MKKKVITKAMVLEKVNLLITTLETDFERSVVHGNMRRKRIALAYKLLKKLSEDKVPPAIILAQFTKHFGDIKLSRKVPLQLNKEVKKRISNPVYLN